MKALVIYYSRTGTTRKVAERLSVDLGADLEEIKEERSRSGVFGFLRSGMEAYMERLPPILPASLDPSQYDLVLIGTPIWANKMASPVRTYVTNNRDRIGAVAFFVTVGGASHEKALAGLENLAGKKPVSTLWVKSNEIGKEAYELRLKGFLSQLKAHFQP